MSWPERPVSELCEFAVDCVNKTAPTVDYETPYEMIRTTNVKGGFIYLDQVRHVTQDVYEKWTRRSVPQFGDVILTREAPVGEVGRCTFTDRNIFLGQRLFHYRPKPEVLNWNYLAYALQSWEVQGKLRGMGFGATVHHIKVGDAESLTIPCPPIGVQEQIGSALAAYDDLIENNRRRIALLEEAARLLYREWFVHFRFPGHEHTTFADGLPEGWERRSLAEVSEIVMGQSPKSTFYNNDGDGLPFHQGVSNFGFRFVTHKTYSTKVTKRAQAGDILLSVRAPVGRINLTKDMIVLGRGLAAIRSKSNVQSFLFYALKNHFYAEDIIGTGAIYAATNKRELESQSFVTPTSRLLLEFNEQAAAIDQQIENLTEQNQKLAQARDLLLPRLMSGELAV